MRFSEFIEDWTQLPFGSLATYKKGPFGSALTKSLFVPKGESTVKVHEQQNAINKDWTLSRYYITNEYYQKMKSFTVYGGDIIVSCAGTIGESYVIPNDAETGVINQALMIIRTNEKVNKIFYLYLFNKVIKAFSEKYSNGSAIKNIPPFSDLKSFQVSIPTIEEQDKISIFLSLIDDRIAVQNKIISKYETLIKGIRHRIFSCVANGRMETLGSFLEEYSEKNTANNLQSVAVGKYGIRKREDIYSKELSPDYSKNKVIRKNTLIIGMGSTQIDIGILTTDNCYCVSPAYTTYRIKGVDSFYLQEYLIDLNPLLSVRYMVTSARQGKAVNKDDLMQHNLAIHSDLQQEKIHQIFQHIYGRLLIVMCTPKVLHFCPTLDRYSIHR